MPFNRSKRTRQDEMTAQHRQPERHSKRGPERTEQEEWTETVTEHCRPSESPDLCCACGHGDLLMGFEYQSMIVLGPVRALDIMRLVQKTERARE
jgi:hypothetical protein